MKRVLDGMVYDTEKAIEICDVWEGTGRSDFQHIDAKLYRTKRSKQFFLAGFGGAMTRFSQRCSDGSYCGSEKIVPLSLEEARHYAENNTTAEILEQYFPVVDADEETYKLKVKVTVSDKHMGGFEKWVEISSQEEFDALVKEWSKYPQTKDFSTTVVLNWMGEDGPMSKQLL